MNDWDKEQVRTCGRVSSSTLPNCCLGTAWRILRETLTTGSTKTTTVGRPNFESGYKI